MTKNITSGTAVGFSHMGVCVRSDVRAKLEKIAASEEVSLSQIFRWAIREYLERHQWRDDQKT